MLHLGSIRGTSIDVDFNFFFLILLFVVINYNQQLGVRYALIWIPVIFVSVLVHELAHAGMIGLLGFGASHIVLNGMGGVTMNQRRAKPWQDLLISLAGPVSSLLLWILCGWAAYNVAFFRTDNMFRVLMPLLSTMNLLWAEFNLIPVPPLDGGHATREFFSMFLTQRTAFIISIWIAFVVGGAIVLYLALTGQYFIAMYIAFFIYLAYQQWDYFKRHGVPGD